MSSDNFDRRRQQCPTKSSHQDNTPAAEIETSSPATREKDLARIEECLVESKLSAVETETSFCETSMQALQDRREHQCRYSVDHADAVPIAGRVKSFPSRDQDAQCNSLAHSECRAVHKRWNWDSEDLSGSRERSAGAGTSPPAKMQECLQAGTGLLCTPSVDQCSTVDWSRAVDEPSHQGLEK